MGCCNSPSNPSAGPGAGASASGGPPPCPTPCIVAIKATVPATIVKRKAAKTRPVNVLRPSASNDESLTTNAPVILVRGCKDVELEAITVPAGQAVSWSVKPNQNSGSAPSITPDAGGTKAKLKTDKTGSFSVIGTLGSCKVVWNVVFVWVEVVVSTSLILRRNLYADSGSSATYGGFKSGDFVTGQFTWEGSVRVRLKGGGSNGKLGISNIRMHVLQNGVADTLTGHYAGGGTALEEPMGGLPVVDSNGNADANPYVYVPSCFKVTPNDTGQKRLVWTADSPTGAFPTSHLHTGKTLHSISGINGFETAIASSSDEARTAICVHAKTAWQADFSGKIQYAGVPPIAAYKKTSAHTHKESRFHLISSGTGGQDACDAGFETFEPRFNGGTNIKWTP